MPDTLGEPWIDSSWMDCYLGKQANGILLSLLQSLHESCSLTQMRTLTSAPKLLFSPSLRAGVDPNEHTFPSEHSPAGLPAGPLLGTLTDVAHFSSTKAYLLTFPKV